MAIALAAILSGNQSYQIRKEGPPLPQGFTNIWTFDPEGILSQTLNPLHALTGREQIADEVLRIHFRLEQIVGLLARASDFQALLGDKQVVFLNEIELTKATEPIPQEPIALDLIDLAAAQGQKQLPPLMLLDIRSDFWGLPQIDMRFVPKPIGLKENRNARIDPTRSFSFNRDTKKRQEGYLFYQKPEMPQGIGRILIEPQNLSFDSALLLAYRPAAEDGITPATLEAVNSYLNFTS